MCPLESHSLPLFSWILYYKEITGNDLYPGFNLIAFSLKRKMKSSRIFENGNIR